MASDQSSQQGMKGEANQSFDSFQKESEAGLKMDGDRGAPGINSGGQAIKPGEGEQDGRPGTIFGGPPHCLLRMKRCSMKEPTRAKKTPRSTESEASVPY